MNVEIMLVLVGMGAGFVQRVSGFGLGIFAMLFFPYFLPSNTASAAVSCIISCGSSTYNAIKYRKNIPVKTLLPVVLAAALTIPIAVICSAYISERIFKVMLGIVLICLSIFFLFFSNRVRIKSTVKNGVLAGAFGGILNGLFSTGGPPIVLYLTFATTSNLAYFSATQSYFAITNIYSTVVRCFAGIITWQLVYYALMGFVGCMIGDMVGRYVFNKLNSNKLKKIIYIGMIISGIFMIK